MYVDLGIQHATRMRRIVIRGLPHPTVFFHIITQTARLTGGGGVIDHKMCLIFFTAELGEM
jgi:hypothetical protein